MRALEDNDDMANFPELRPGDPSAEAERIAVLRSASPVRFAALVAFAAAIFVAVMQLGGQSRAEGAPPFLTEALGAYEADAPLVRHPAPGVVLAIEDAGFRIQSQNTTATVTLETQGFEPGDWHRFANGASRPTAVGAETILVDGPTLEQFLTVRERQGPRTWRWRIDSTRPPRLGGDGGIAFLDAKLHKLADVSIAPVRILDAEGKNITPNGLRWGLERRNGVSWLTLRLDDAKLPLPYVIDPAVTHRNTQTGTQASGTTVTVNKPTGVQANDLLVAHVVVVGNVTASLTASGWTQVTPPVSAGNAATQASYYKVAGGSEPASYSFSWTTNHAAVASVTAYYGVKSTSPFDVSSTIVSTNNTTTVTANGVTTTANDDIVLAFFASASNSTYTPPAGWTEHADIGVAGVSGSVADKIQATAGATGNVNATATVSARVFGHQGAFKVDDVAPSVTMSDPGSPVTGTITLQTSAASDTDSYVAQVQFQRSPAGAGSWTNVGSADTTSPYSVSFDTTTVTDGLYDFRAVATDGAGNTANSATISNRRIDNTAPSSTTTFPASSGSYNASGWNAGCGTNGFCGTYSDAGSGVQKVEISIRRNTGNYWNGSSFGSGSEVWNTTSLSGGNWSYTFPASNFPADDTYTIRVHATDNVSIAETPSSRSFTYDTAAPNTSITSNPSDPTTSTSASLSFTSTEGGSTFECELDGGGYSSCTSPKSYAGPLSDGSHTFTVRATDAAGNTDATPASFTWTIDTTAPSSTTSFPGSGSSYNTSGWNAGCATNGFCGTYSDATSGVQSVEISIRQGAGNYWSAGSFSSGSEVWNTTTLAGGNWSYSFPASNFPADGTYTIRVRATDNVNLVETPSSRSFTIDRTAPNTTIDSNPSDPTSSTSASFTFSSTEGGSTFECQLDGGSYSSCSSPKSYTSLSEGSHTFLVRATDGAGNTDGSAASYMWTVDSVAPGSTTSFPASAGIYNTSSWNAGCGTIGFCGTYSDATSGVSTVQISIRHGAGNYWSAGSFSSASEVWNTTSLSAGNWSYAFSAADFPADGSYTIRVRATDNAANVETPASRTFTYDITNPGALFTFPASGGAYKNADWNAGCGTNGFCGTYSDATSGVQSVEISIRQGAGNYWNGSSFGSGSEVFQTASLAGGNWSYSFPASNFPADGSYTVHVRAKDNALNTETGPSRSFTIDTVNPSALFTFPASGWSYNTSGWSAGCATNGFCGTYSDATSGVQSVEISIRQGAGNYWNGSSFGSASETWNLTSIAAGNWEYAFAASSFPADDSYTVHVRAKDNALNTESGPSRSFTIDTAAPNTTIDSNPSDPSNSANASFTFNSTEGSSAFECEIDGGGFSVCSTPKSYSGLSEGSHTFKVRATDLAGNTDGSPAQYTWTVDTVAPNTTIDSNPSDPSNSANASFTFNSTEGSSAFECEIDGGGFSVCSTPKSYSGLSEGSHTFKVRATDQAGNTDASPAQYTWTVDTVAPSSTTSFPASGADYNAASWNAGCGTIGFCGTYSDATTGVQKVEISIRRGTGNYWNGTGFSSGSEVWNLTSLSAGNWSYAFATTDFPADGSYTIRVKATDNAGNGETPASRSFTYDTADPSSTTTFPAASGSYSTAGWNAGCATIGFCGTYSDATSGVLKVEVSIRRGTGNYWNGSSFGSASETWNLTSIAAGNWELAFGTTDFPADGSYTIRVKATDNAGNGESPASRSFTYDTADPNTTIDSSPNLSSNSAAATFTFSSTEGSSAFECEIDGGGFSSCSTPKSYSGLSEGSHTFKVRATDAAGNTDGSPAQLTWTVDTVNPSAVFTFPAASGNYDSIDWNAGCTSSGFCGTYSDATSGVQAVEISIRQGTGNYWNGSAFASASEVFQSATTGGGNWSYAFPASSFPAGGNYTVHVRATDNATNTESGPSRTFTYDTTPPETTIDSNPSDPSTSANATFTFSADEGGSTFECELDGGGFSSCSSPKSYSSLSDGSHTFKVKATDGAGNGDPSPAQYAWTVDTTAPSSTTTFPASSAAYNASGWNAGCPTAGFCGTYSDATSGVQKVEISIRRGTGNYWNGTGFSSGSEVWNLASLSGGDWSYAFATTDFPADGTYTIRVKATDNAGNGESPASRSFTYDTADPGALFSFPASGGDYPDSGWNAGCGTVGFCGTYSDATSGVQAVEISIRRGTGNYWNGSSFGSGSEVFQTASLSAGNWSYALPAASFPADGAYTVHVRAKDNALNTETGPSRTFRIDNTNPSALFTFPASGGDYSGSGWNAGCGTNGFCGTYSDATSGVQAVEISIRQGTGNYWNGTSFSSVSEDFQAASFSGGNWSYAFPATAFPADGSYTVHVRAHDAAGNTETGPSRTFTYDSTPPETTIDSNPSDPSTSANATFTFSADEGGSTFECKLDGGGFGACTSPKSYTGLSDGSHTFEVRALDSAGNTDATPAQSAWTIDTVAASSTVTFPGAGGFYRTSTWNAGCTTSGFCGTYSDATSGVQAVELSIKRVGTGLYWNGSAFSSGSELFFTTSLSGGSWSYAFGAASFPADDDYTLRVKATDNAGNAQSASSRTFTFDATAPTGSLTAPADGAVVSGASVTVSSDSADTGSGVAVVTFERRPADGGSWTTVDTDSSAPYSVSWNTTSVTDGDYDLRVTTEDESGNSFASTTRTVTVDNTAPSSATLDALPGAIRNGQALTGSGADAGSGVASLTYYYCAGPPCSPSTLIATSTTGPSYSVTWSSQPADGDYQVRARVTDRAGLTLDSTKQTVTIDNTSPTGSLTAPSDGASVSGTIAVSSDSADSGSGVAGAAFERRPSGGGSWTSIQTDTTAPYSVSWGTTPLADGDYDLRVVTTDVAGNTFTSSTRTVHVDNHAPTVSVTAPGAYVSGAAGDPFPVTATSPDSDIASVEFFACSNQSTNCSSGSWSSLGAPDTTAPYSASWDVQGDGNQAFRAVITDNASNTGSDVVNTTVDRTDPTGSVTAPAGGAFLSETVPVSSDSADSGSGVASAAFESRPSGGGSWTSIAADTSVPYSVSWDTATLNGDFDLHVVTTDVAGNTHTSAAVTVTVDNTAPSDPVVSLSESSPYAFVSAQTVYVNTSQSGSYDVSATSSDAQSGIEKIRFPGPVDDTSSPYGASYGFGALSGTQTVTTYSGAGLTASSNFTVTPDTDGPNAFSLTTPGAGATVANGQTVSASPLDAGAGTDQVEFRYCAGSSCSFSAGTTIGAPDSTAPYSVTWNGQPADGTYTIVARATDNVGNTTDSGERTVTVDNTGPSSVLSVDEGTRPDLQYFDAATDTYYYNPAATGDFTVHEATTDPAGVASVDFPAIADTGFTGSAKNDTTVPFDSDAYTFTTASASAPATQTVVATDALGNVTNDAFDLVRDVTAPTGGSVSYADGYDADGTVVVTTANGSDGSAGVDTSSGVLERRTSALSNGSCAGFSGGWTNVTSPDTVASGLCAQYRYRVSDRVGNEATYTSTNVVKVDLSAPSAPSLTLSESSSWAFVSGTTIYLNTAQTGSFDVDAATSDAESGIDKVFFPAGQDDTTSPYKASYAFGDLSGSQTVTSRSGAGLTSSSNFTVTADTAAPSGGSASYTDGYDADGQITIATANGTDALSGVDASSGVLERRTSALSNDSCAGFSGGWTTVSSPDSVATDTCAQYRYRVSDNVGNEATYTSTNVVKVDLTAPNTSIGSSPNDPTNSTDATFTFTSTEGGSTFECELDGGGFSSCSTPKSYSSLGDGSHTFKVRASDLAGNTDGSPAQFTWTVDTAAPNTPIGSTPNDPTNSTDATFTFTSTEGGSTFECELDGGGFSSCSTPKSYSGLSEGSHTFKVRATDVAGNTDGSPAQFTWTVDTAAPNTSIGSTPNDPTNSTDATFTFTSTEGGSTFECELDGGGFSSCSTPKSYSGLSEGSHTFKVRATDAAGNTDGSPAQFTWTVDTASPDTTIDVFPPDPDSSSSPSFEFSADQSGSTFECKLDGGSYTSCASPKSYSSLGEGSHTFQVRATDPAGNTDGSPASYAWSVNAGAPTVSITAPSGFVSLADADPFTLTATSPDGDIANVEFFRCTDSSSDCSTGSWVSIGTDTTAPYTAPWSLPADGNAALRAVATDAGSNTGEDVVDVTVDRTRPVTSIDSAPAHPTNATGASFDFTASEAGVTFQCRLDGGAYGACSSPKSYSSIGDGSHTFDVQATDQAGNTEAAPESYTWTVDTASPDTSITANPSDPSGSSSADFSFTSTEGGSSFECRVDGGSFAPCTSPASYTGLADGSHAFRVRATDPAGNTDPSPEVFTWTIDATPPGGGLADPGTPLRGTVGLSASPSDTGVGVQQVVFQSSPANAGTWTAISTDTTAPYTASWDTSAETDGLYDLRIVVTDNASNSTASAVVEDRLVDNTSPSVSMDDPGANLSGTVSLTSTNSDGGSGIDTVTYQRSPAGAGTWTTVAAAWNTTAVADGLYDLRVRVTDNAGNVATSAPVLNRRVDNSAPTLASSTPADGSKIASASSLAVTANENLADVFDSEIDGTPIAGAVTGSTITFTQAFAAGPHTLSGELEDLAGNRTPIRVHFTAWNTAAADYPYIEKNSFAGSAMTVAATNGVGQLTVPAAAWSGAPAGDWLVARVDPRPAGPVATGFQAAGDIYDVSAYWALSGGPVTSFDEPLDLKLTNGAGAIVPALLNGSAWQPIPRLTGTSLAGGMQQGFYKDGDTVHLLTRSTGTFTLLRDMAAPKKPKGFNGKNVAGRLVLSWKATSDNSGLVDAYIVYAKGAVAQTVSGSTLSVDMGAFSQKDTRSFQVAARDAAGNVSGKTLALVVVPKVARLPLAKARSALSKRGLKAGAITYVFSSVPKGSVVSAGKSGLVTKGSAVPLAVSKGLARRSSPRDTDQPLYQPSPAPPPSSPTPPGSTPPSQPQVDVDPPEPESAVGAAAAEPESFNASDDVSSARRTAGLVLLGSLFLGAGAMVLRARRKLLTRVPPAENLDGPILFWDERLFRATASGIRRAMGSLGR